MSVLQLKNWIRNTQILFQSNITYTLDSRKITEYFTIENEYSKLILMTNNTTNSNTDINIERRYSNYSFLSTHSNTTNYSNISNNLLSNHLNYPSFSTINLDSVFISNSSDLVSDRFNSTKNNEYNNNSNIINDFKASHMRNILIKK